MRNIELSIACIGILRKYTRIDIVLQCMFYLRVVLNNCHIYSGLVGKSKKKKKITICCAKSPRNTIIHIKNLETIFVDGWAGIRYAHERVKLLAGDEGLVDATGQLTGLDSHHRIDVAAVVRGRDRRAAADRKHTIGDRNLRRCCCRHDRGVVASRTTR